MHVKPLTPVDLTLAASLLVLLGLLSWRLRLGLAKNLAVAAALCASATVIFDRRDLSAG